MVGLCIGQVNLIALWSSLAPGNIVVRVSWGCLLTMAMWYALVLGRPVSRSLYGDLTREDAITLVIVLFVGVVALQIPLWVAKKLFRWRLIRSLDAAETWRNEDRQFHVRHMLIATFFVAAALSPMRQVLPVENRTYLHHDSAMYVTVPVAILCNFLATIPCIWWAFASARSLARVILGWLVYTVVLTAIEFSVFYAAFGAPPDEKRVEAFATVYTVNVSQCAAVIVTLLILRSIGFRLVRMPRPGAKGLQSG